MKIIKILKISVLLTTLFLFGCKNQEIEQNQIDVVKAQIYKEFNMPAEQFFECEKVGQLKINNQENKEITENDLIIFIAKESKEKMICYKNIQYLKKFLMDLKNE